MTMPGWVLEVAMAVAGTVLGLYIRAQIAFGKSVLRLLEEMKQTMAKQREEYLLKFADAKDNSDSHRRAFERIDDCDRRITRVEARVDVLDVKE